MNWLTGKGTELSESGLIVAFDKPVAASTLSDRSFEVLTKTWTTERKVVKRGPNGIPTLEPFDVFCYCGVPGTIEGVNVQVSDSNPPVLTATTPADPSAGVTGVRFRLLDDRGFPAGTYIVLLHGDLILSQEKLPVPGAEPRRLALDGNNLGPGVSGGRPSGDGIEGGLYRSGFMVAYRAVNKASADQLSHVVSQLEADAIFNARRDQKKPFGSFEEIEDVRGLNNPKITVAKLRDHMLLD